MDSENVDVCNPPSAYTRWVSELWNRATMVICLLVVLCYVFTYVMLYKIAPGGSASSSQIQMQRTVLKTLTINVVAFVISSIGSSAVILIIGLLHVDAAIISIVEAYAVIP
ncbi:Protein SRSX-15, partial [Aphelenchoides avenae]